MKLSIIIPAYNVENYIVECIESVLDQSLKHSEYEIIVINDGSSDNTRSILTKYEKMYKNIILINQKNYGQSYSRNIGIKHAKGDFILFLDSDDLIGKANSLEKSLNLLEKDNLDILMFDANVFFDSDYSESRMKYNSKSYDRSNVITENDINNGVYFFCKYYIYGGYKCSPCLYITRKNHLYENKIIFTTGLVFEDEEFTLKNLLYAKKVKYVNEKIYSRRIRNNSTMTSIMSIHKCKSLEKILYKNFDFIIKIMSKTGNEVFKLYILDLFSVLIGRIILLDEDIELVQNLIKENISKFISMYYEAFGADLDVDRILVIKYIAEILKEYDLDKFFSKYFCYIYKLSSFEEQLNIKQINLLREKFKNMHLNDSSKTIGIYGLGCHTIQLLNFYSKYICNINSNIIFIDSYKNTLEEKFLDKDIINIKDINQYDLDEVILSSCSYEKELYDNLKKHKFNKPIHRFYNKNRSNIFKL